MDKPRRRKMQHNSLNLVFAPCSAAGASRGSVDRAIRAFLAGENHGEALLEQLYGHVADEPVPEHLLALLRP